MKTMFNICLWRTQEQQEKQVQEQRQKRDRYSTTVLKSKNCSTYAYGGNKSFITLLSILSTGETDYRRETW